MQVWFACIQTFCLNNLKMTLFSKILFFSFVCFSNLSIKKRFNLQGYNLNLVYKNNLYDCIAFNCLYKFKVKSFIYYIYIYKFNSN